MLDCETLQNMFKNVWQSMFPVNKYIFHSKFSNLTAIYWKILFPF